MRYVARQSAEQSPAAVPSAALLRGACGWIFAVFLMCLFLPGCEEVPTFQELIGQEEGEKPQKKEGQPAPPPERPTTEVAKLQPAPAKVKPNPTPEQVAEKYSSKPSPTFGNEDLADLSEGLQDQTDLMAKLDIRGSRQVNNRGAAHIGRLSSLTYLDMGITNVTNDGLTALENLQDLEVLHLNGLRISSSAMQHLSGLVNLRVLDISDTRVDDEGLRYLADLVNLETFRFSNTEITGGAIAYLRRNGGLSNLRHIEAKRTKFGHGLNDLRALKTLETLEATQANIGDGGMVGLQSCVNLRVLDIGGNRLSDRGLIPLQRLRKLEDVSLRNNDLIRGMGLEALINCKDLKHLDLSGTGAAKQYIFALKEHVPDVTIEKDGTIY